MFLVVSFVFFADWISKFYIRQNLSVGESIPVIKDIFYVTYLKNRGIIFGLFFPSTFFIIFLSGVAILALMVFLRKIFREARWFKISLGLLWGGLLANFFDRLQGGDIIDFLNFRFLPVFNLADIAICIGAGLFLEKVIILQWPETKT